MPEDFSAEVKSEGAALDIDKAFDRLDAKGETPSESQTEKDTTDKPSQGGDNTPEEKTPFHKHPRWIQTQNELKELREETARLKKDRESSSPVALPEWWKKQYGDTDESKERYSLVTQKDGELDWIKQSILGEIDQRAQTETNTAKEGEVYVDTQLAEMADEGMKFEKNVLLKFMVDFQEEFGAGSLLDTEGNYDFRKALALQEKMQPREVEDNSTRKQLAGLAGRAKVSAGTTSKIPVVSRRALRNGNWRDAL